MVMRACTSGREGSWTQLGVDIDGEAAVIIVDGLSR